MKKNYSKFNIHWFENYETTNMYKTLSRAFRLSRAFIWYPKCNEGPHGSRGWRHGHKTNTSNVVKIPPSKKKGSYTSFRISKYMFSLFQDLKCRVWIPLLVWHFTWEVLEWLPTSLRTSKAYLSLSLFVYSFSRSQI
jgi:hypothetical protein